MNVKFQVTTEWPDFQMTEDPFEIVVKDRYGRVKKEMGRDGLFWDADGHFYFTLEDVRRGVYFAYFKGTYEDEDYDDQRAVVTDMQELLRVPSVALEYGCENTIFRKGCRCMHKVHYRLVWTVSVDGDDYLCGSDGKYILTSDGKRICFKSDKRKQIEDMGKVILATMTGDEFKQFIEGRNPDGDIDTVPEMMDALQGISDDETVKEEIQSEVAESDVERVSPEDLDNFEV